jgi:hypothetical protein
MAKNIKNGVIVEGAAEIIRRFGSEYPMKAQSVFRKMIDTILLVLQGEIPGYPPKPSSSNYDRTGQLGRSLGSSQSGGMLGSPDIREIRQLGMGSYEGRLGSILEYASDVIGPKGIQRAFFAQYWWRLESVLGKSFSKIMGVVNRTVKRIAAFLRQEGNL